MFRPPLGIGTDDEYIQSRLKRHHASRLRGHTGDEMEPGGLFFSRSAISVICGVGFVTGVALFLVLVFHGL